MMIINILSLFFAVVSLVLGLYRLIVGPSLYDRVLALDYLFFLGVVCVGGYFLFTGEVRVLDIGLLMALVGFVVTLAFGRDVKEEENK